MHENIEKIYASGTVVGRSGNTHKLHSCIDRREADFLYALIRSDTAIVRTLEVGGAYGLSGLVICSAIQGRNGAAHTMVDPFQNTDWDGGGTLNLESAGFRFFNLIEHRSELALPQLLESSEGRFDFIFIDGWHTFDHTLVDCFYATRLLRVGGYLAVDDVHFPSVRRVIDFITRYPCYEVCGSVDHAIKPSWKKKLIRAAMRPIQPGKWRTVLSSRLHRRIFADEYSTMIALRKVSQDTRNWDWHEELF